MLRICEKEHRQRGHAWLMHKLESSTERHVDLTGVQLGEEGVRDIALLLSHDFRLEHLNLSFCRIPDVDLSAMERLLVRDSLRASGLRKLILRGNGLTLEGDCALLRSLRHNAGLESLDLGRYLCCFPFLFQCAKQ
jgi:hypothetical protein